MPIRTHLLVVANQTVDSPDLLTALEGRAEQGPIHVTLLVPVLWSEREAARARLEEACSALRERGIEAEAVLGDADPMVAVQEVWDPGRFDEIVVSTFTTGASRWMQVDLPHRIAKLTDCTVRHVESHPAPEPAPTAPPPQPRGLFESAVGLLRTGTRGRAA
jgi:sirohydrochlorin ferrochelatase